MPSPPSSYDSHSYIPADVSRAMDQHMQSLPASYRSYVDPSRPGFVPPNVEKTIMSHMNNMPAHLKQYAGAYMQQRVIEPSLNSFNRPVVMPSGPRTAGPPPVPDPRRLSHSVPVGEQPTAQPNTATSGFVTPPAGSQPPTPASPTQPFDFIMNPAQAPKRSPLSFSGGSSLAVRIVALSGGLLLLLIAFIIIKGALSSGPDWKPFVAVTQDQQELVHISGEAAQQQGLSDLSQNLAATVQLSVGSAQATIIQYLSGNHQKVSTKELNLKINSLADSQLTTAASNGDYDQVFQADLQTQLTTYSKDLSLAYNGAGPKGKTLLKSDYNQTKLLLGQLTSVASSSN